MRGQVPPLKVYIHVLLNRLGEISVNHFYQPYKVTESLIALYLRLCRQLEFFKTENQHN